MEMQKAGYNRTAIQCRVKLRAEHKKAKDHNSITGRGTRKWRYFKRQLETPDKRHKRLEDNRVAENTRRDNQTKQEHQKRFADKRVSENERRDNQSM